MKVAAAAVAVLVLVTQSWADRGVIELDKAKDVITGTVVKVTPKEEAFGGNGINVIYTVEVKVTKVEKGQGVNVGDTLTVTWTFLKKKPAGNFAAAQGFDYGVKKDDRVRVHLAKKEDGGYEVLYNKDGMVKLKK